MRCFAPQDGHKSMRCPVDAASPSLITMTHRHNLKPLLLRPWVYWAALAIGVVSINGILFSGAYNIIVGMVKGYELDPATAGEFGDFVGGYVGAYIALFGAMGLLYTLALQQQQLRQQEEQTKRERFEAKYYELINLHRNNVSEMELPERQGRRVFMAIFNEAIEAIHIVKDVVKDVVKDAEHLPSIDVVRIGYTCVFFGVGRQSSRLLLAALAPYDPNFIRRVVWTLEQKRLAWEQEDGGYRPFDGHQSRLGHYYRHLFQAVSFIAEKAPGDGDAKKAYAKTLRAQLSTHEQAVLLLNSLSYMGREWWDRHFIVDFAFVKNLPKDFIDPEVLRMELLFKPGYFEWEEVSTGLLLSPTGHRIF